MLSKLGMERTLKSYSEDLLFTFHYVIMCAVESQSLGTLFFIILVTSDSCVFEKKNGFKETERRVWEGME